MSDYKASTYGDKYAEVYDRWFSWLDTDAAVERLSQIAGPGPLLELGIGTGRLALPLLERGIEVHGIDASEAMIAKLRAKPGGERIPVTVGDFADVGVGGEFSLIFVAFSTLFALLTQDDQARCFHNVAVRLKDGGRFVVEAFFPDLNRFQHGQHVGARDVETDSVVLEVSTHDAARQRIDSQHIALSEEGTQFYPIKVRYAWPSELDLMAKLAGLSFENRWGGWKGEAFTASSSRHVSVYRSTTAKGG